MNIIDKGMETIQRDGWWKDNRSEPDPSYKAGSTCVLLSINMQGDDAEKNYDAKNRALDLIAEEIGAETSDSENRCQALFDWNDDPATSIEDLFLVMKRASARLDAEYGGK